MHRADRFIGISLRREENAAILALAKSRGLTKAQLGRALLRAGRNVFENDPEEVLPLARI
jgi:hypothetical protein